VAFLHAAPSKTKFLIKTCPVKSNPPSKPILMTVPFLMAPAFPSVKETFAPVFLPTRRLSNSQKTFESFVVANITGLEMTWALSRDVQTVTLCIVPGLPGFLIPHSMGKLIVTSEPPGIRSGGEIVTVLPAINGMFLIWTPFMVIVWHNIDCGMIKSFENCTEIVSSSGSRSPQPPVTKVTLCFDSSVTNSGSTE